MGSGLALLAPKGLWLLGLLVPLVVLYILKVRRERRRVSSTWLWAAARRDLMARSPFRKLVAQVPLLLQAIALLALGRARARPATRGRELLGDHVAGILDVSAAMAAALDAAAAADPASPRWIDRAKEAAKAMVSALPPGSDVLVIEAGREARIASPLDRDPQRVKAAIDRVGAREVEGDLGAAVALAVDRLRQLGGSRRVVVFTDGHLARPASLLGAALPIEVVTVGAPIENAAIVRVDVRSGTEPGEGGREPREQVQAFLVVANYGTTPRDLYVTMREENASDVLASRRVLVQPGERLPVVLTFHPAPADYRKGLLFDVAPHDALPVDDVAYARVPAGDKLPVFLAGADEKKPASPWLERALASDPMAEVRTGTVASLAPGAGSIAGDTFVVVDGACPADPAGGDLLVVDPPPGPCMGTLVGATLEHPMITSWENGDPRMRFLTLDGVHVAKAHLLKPEGATQELIRTQEGAIAADVSTPTRTVTLLGFDVGESDWPLKASFVLFTRNLLEQARAHRAHGMTGPARAGEPMRVSVPASAKQVAVEGPGRDVLDLPVRGGLVVIPEIPRAGLYHLSWQGPQAGSIVVPANLASEAESDLRDRPVPAQAPGQEPVTIHAAGTLPEGHSEWAWVLALVALAFIVLDVWFLTRDPRPRAVAAAVTPRIQDRKVG